jgi:hypothetical protein
MAVLALQAGMVGTFEYRLQGQATWHTVGGVDRSTSVLLLGPDDEIRFYSGGELERAVLTFAAW